MTGSGQPSLGQPSPAQRSPLRALLNVVTEFLVVLVMALALSLVVKTFLVQAFTIPSGSMEKTLLVGDRVLVSKLTPSVFDLHRGDVVVFKDPGGWLDPATSASATQSLTSKILMFVGLLPVDSGQHLIKRVIGLPGDLVACDDQLRLSVNGVTIKESYIYPDDPQCTPFSQTVPAGKIWVMGDHRSVSRDSRYNLDTFASVDSVVGKAFVVIWPLPQMGGVASSGSAFSAVS